MAKDLKDYTNEELVEASVKLPKGSDERKSIEEEMAKRFYRYAIRSMIPLEETRPGK